MVRNNLIPFFFFNELGIIMNIKYAINSSMIIAMGEETTHQEGVVRWRQKLVDTKIMYRIEND